MSFIAGPYDGGVGDLDMMALSGLRNYLIAQKKLSSSIVDSSQKIQLRGQLTVTQMSWIQRSSIISKLGLDFDKSLSIVGSDTLVPCQTLFGMELRSTGLYLKQLWSSFNIRWTTDRLSIVFKTYLVLFYLLMCSWCACWLSHLIPQNFVSSLFWVWLFDVFSLRKSFSLH